MNTQLNNKFTRFESNERNVFIIIIYIHEFIRLLHNSQGHKIVS